MGPGDGYQVMTLVSPTKSPADQPYWYLKFESTALLVLTVVCTLGLGFTLFFVQRLRNQIRGLEVVGPYTLLEKIGEGGMGQVYLARHTLLKRPTAVKLLRPELRNRRTIDQFEREVQIASQLLHPNSIEIFD